MPQVLIAGVAAASCPGISVPSSSRLRRRALEHGQAMSKLRGKVRETGKIKAHGGFIGELLAEQRDMTLIEVQMRLIECSPLVGFCTG